MASNFDIKTIKWSIGKYGLPEAHIKIPLPSVTRIINEMIPDPGLEEWILKVGQEQADKIMIAAGHRGTAMHLFIENFVNMFAKTKDVSAALKHTQIESPKTLLLDEIPERKINEGRDLFYKFYYSTWANKYENLIATEIGIYSPTSFFRGKADVFYHERIYGPSVTDFKSANDYIKKGSIKELKYKTQLGGYASALDDMYVTKNLHIKRSSILCINTKNDNLQEIICEGKELEHFKNEFKTLTKNWHINNNNNFLFEKGI